MGFKDILKKVGEKTKELVDTASKNYRYNKKLEETKFDILMKFKMNDLRKICRKERISTTKPRDFFDDTRIEIKRKSELVDKMVGIPLDRIINYAKKYKISFKDELKELEEFKRMLYEEKETEEHPNEVTEDVKDFLDEEFAEILDLVDIFEPEIVRNEEDFEKQLFQFLKAAFRHESKISITRQERIGDTKIDIVIYGKRGRYGIELKIADNKTKLQTLVGQVMEYREYFDQILAIILDVGYNVDLGKFQGMLNGLGVEVKILKGVVRKIGKRKEIVIKY
ncbi:MAG: hypothetical protein H0Z28_12035 [Archaeoglobus sp.]|nr:hypothetical protein [Archaeoglobus sp.]